MRNGAGQLRIETMAVFIGLNDRGGTLDDSGRRYHTHRPPIERRTQHDRQQCVSLPIHDSAETLYQVTRGPATDDYS